MANETDICRNETDNKIIQASLVGVKLLKG